MKDNGIEDILIDNNYNSNKKKSKKGIIIIFVLLLIVLIALCGAYWYFTRPVTTAKELFFNHLSNTNMETLIEKNIYQDLFNKLQNQDSEITQEISFLTNFENENLEGLDVSKFVLDFNSSNNIENKKSYSELGINYSGNEVLKINMLSNNEAFGIASDEIVNKYVGFRYDSLENSNNISELLKDFSKNENIDFTEEEKKEFIKKYVTKLSENISDEKFSYQDNFVLDGSESMNVVAYTLKLNQEEFKNLSKTLLTELKNDDELLKKIIKEPKSSIIATDEEEQINITEEPESNSQVEQENMEQELEDNSQEQQENTEVVEDNSQVNQEENENNSLENSEDNLNSEFKTNATVNLKPVSNKDEEQNNIYENIVSIFLGKKINISLENIKNEIDKLIEEIDTLEGNGIIFNIYASEIGTEKINLVLPNESSFDIEFKNRSNDSTNVKITYLYKGNNNIFEFLNSSIKDVYTSENPIVTTKDKNLNTDTSKNSGYSLEINKNKKDASNNIKIIFSFIESEEINRKISLESKLEGTTSSKNFKNDNILTISTQDEETKIMLSGNIKFKDVDSIQDLKQDNTVFLEDLSEEEYDITVQAIKDKILQVFNEKKEKFNFIDTNIGNSVIQQNLNSNDNKENAKKALESKIEELRKQAEENETEFNLQSLNDLKIDGYEVSTVISEEKAVVVIDIYTFNIDREFNITNEE